MNGSILCPTLLHLCVTASLISYGPNKSIDISLNVGDITNLDVGKGAIICCAKVLSSNLQT